MKNWMILALMAVALTACGGGDYEEEGDEPEKCTPISPPPGKPVPTPLPCRES